MAPKKIVIAVFVLSAVWFGVQSIVGKGVLGMNEVKKPLKAWLGARSEFPDPARIEVAGDWYVLDHLSGGLVGFDHEEGQFKPVLAKPWTSHNSKIHTFTLREDARFSDGSDITAEDVVASLKRLLIKKTSTHFPLWEYIEGCDRLKSLADECPGLKAINNRTIEIRLTRHAEGFFLQLASPETGIWAKGDIDPESLKIKPSKFSGPYELISMDTAGIRLKKNSFHPFTMKFPDSPEEINISLANMDTVDDMLKNGELDLIIRDHKPFAEEDWDKHGVKIYDSAPSTLIYLYGTRHDQGKPLVGREFLNNLWQTPSDPELMPAKSFLPFGREYSLTESEVMGLLPEAGAGEIKLAVPWTYFSDKFLNHLVAVAKKSAVELKIIRLERSEFLTAIDSKTADQKFDFILVPYAASERYPAVQLRYLTGSVKRPPVDLKDAEAVELSPEKYSTLKEYQRWLLREQHAIPLYFVRNLIIYRDSLDVGKQSVTDAEVELWRVRQK